MFLPGCNIIHWCKQKLWLILAVKIRACLHINLLLLLLLCSFGFLLQLPLGFNLWQCFLCGPQVYVKGFLSAVGDETNERPCVAFVGQLETVILPAGHPASLPHYGVSSELID
ncbi:hypothetical protein E2C01_069445 [Portunus trituberculatus]|uniref:Uncharacterized protein n=1 Tax=Portunus trituberculatus TaxID=210409 RepID=A0A5B7HUJ4_PORTR|nr:hypothetical protein [Portunus trituberculatus]